MSVFAALKIPVDLTRRRGAALKALEILQSFPGARNLAVDGAAQTLSLELHFPGNLTALVDDLLGSLIPVGAKVEVTVPLATPPADAAALEERLLEGNEVWDVAFPRDRYVYEAHVSPSGVTATIVPSTGAMHEIYDVLLGFNLLSHGGSIVPAKLVGPHV